MKRVLAVVIAAIGLSASSPQDPKTSIIWAKSWAEAVAEASIRNVPIHLTIHKDG